MGLISEKGSIEIVFENKEYSPGEIITGSVKLKLEKPVKARALKVAFFGNRSLKYGGKASQDVFSVAKILSGSRAYQNGETYTFAIQIPDNIVGYPIYNYFLKAYLDLPAKLDILKIADIKINWAKTSNRWAKGQLYLVIIGTVALFGLLLVGGLLPEAVLLGLCGGAYALYIYFIGVKSK